MNREQNVERIDETTKGTRARLTGKTAVVKCAGFRCLATLGKDGVWRDTHGQPLEVLEVVTQF